jgi:catechol 2,3-dioxygenase-like lactoylglutathione lyase family enzyme
MSLANATAVTTLTASDMDRAKAFWTEKLGLKLASEQPDPGGAYLEAGNGTNIFIYNSGAPKATNTVVSFKVDDVLATVNELKGKGVQFESYDMGEIKTDENNIATWEGKYHAAWFKDSEGNIICVGNL